MVVTSPLHRLPVEKGLLNYQLNVHLSSGVTSSVDKCITEHGLRYRYEQDMAKTNFL